MVIFQQFGKLNLSQHKKKMKEISLTATCTVDCSSLETLHCTWDFQEMFASFSVGVSAYLMARMWDAELQK